MPSRWRRPLIGALVVLAAAMGAAGWLAYKKLIEKGFIRYNKWDRRVRGKLRTGDQSPDVELTRYFGSTFRLSSLWAKRPVVLVFGSCTCPPFRKKIGDLRGIYARYKEEAEFLTVYVSEAHPDDEWQTESNRKDRIVFNRPRGFEERRQAAKILVERLEYDLPVAIDSMDDQAEAAYAAWPERMYVVAAGGRIVYRGGLGPFGFDPQEMEKALAAHLTAGAIPPRLRKLG